MTKEQENLIQQRIDSKKARRLRARYNGRIKDTAHNPGFTFGKGGGHDYQAFAAQW